MSSAARDIIGPSGKLEEQWVIVPNFTYTAEWLVTVRTVGGGNPDPAVPRVRLPGEYSVDARTVRVDAFMPDWFPNFVRKTMVPPYTEDDPQKKWDYLVNMRLRDPTTAQGIYTRAESRPRSKKGFPKGHDAFMAELYRDTSKEITLKAPDGSAVWWTDLDSGPIRIATLWDLIGLHHRGQPKIEKGKALWLLSGDQWDKAEYPAPSKGGPPYIEGVSVARDPGKMPAMTMAHEDYPDFEAALQAASSRWGATHVVRQGNRSAVIYSPTSKGYERRSLSCDRGFFHWPKQADLVDEVPENAERVVDVLDIGFDPDAPPRREAAPVRRAAEEAGTRKTLDNFRPSTVPEGTVIWLQGSTPEKIENFLNGLEERGLTMIYAGPGDRYQVVKNPPGLTRTSQKSLIAEEARGSDRERWEKLQSEFRRLTDEMTKVESEAHVKWGPHGLRYAARSLQTKHEKLVASRNRVFEKIFAMTQKLSPRDWGTGVPTWWVAGKLTFDDLVRPQSEPLSVTPPLAYGATRPMQEGAREMGAVREVMEGRGREGRRYEYPEWLEFECEPAQPTPELKELASELKKLLLEFLSSYARTWSIDTSSLDEDSFVWNAYASIVGHGVGLWEGDGDTGLRGEDEKKIDKALRGRWHAGGSLVGRIHNVAHQISDECAMLQGPEGREAREEASIPTKAQLKIINAFREHRLMGNPMRDSISTDGDTIYSYRMPIARRTSNGGISIVDPAGAPSATTRNHIYGLQRTFTPAEIAGTQAAEARDDFVILVKHGSGSVDASPGMIEVIDRARTEANARTKVSEYRDGARLTGTGNYYWYQRADAPRPGTVGAREHDDDRGPDTERAPAPEAAPRLQPGYAFYTPSKRKGDWKKIPNDDWEHVVVGEDEIEKSDLVGMRLIDGSMHDIFEVNFAAGRGGRGYYAQLQTHTRGRSAAHEGAALLDHMANDFTSPKDAIMHAQSAWGATHVDFHGTRNSPTVYGTKDGARWKKTLFKEKGKFHWPDKFSKGPKRLHGAIELTPVAAPAPRHAPTPIQHHAPPMPDDDDRHLPGQSDEAREGSWSTHPFVQALPDQFWVQVGTLSHNRDFTLGDFTQYTGHSGADLRKLITARMIRRTEQNHYYPTSDGWARIEKAYGYSGEARESDRRYTTKQSPKDALRDDVFFEGLRIGHIRGPFRASSGDFYEWQISRRSGRASTRRAALSDVIRAHKASTDVREARENPATDLQDAIPWVRVTRDPERYKEALARAKAIGPIDDAKKVYELVGPALLKEDQETFIVVLIDVRQNCRGVAEIHRGARSRVATSVLDVMRVVVAAGAEGFIVCHNHPSGKAMPSDADRSLTKAIERAAKPFSGETAFLDHVVIGAGEYFSFADNKLHRAK